MQCLKCFTSMERDPVPTAHEVRWAPRLVWMAAENLTLTGIWSLDSPAHNKSLHWLCNHGPPINTVHLLNWSYCIRTTPLFAYKKKRTSTELQGNIAKPTASCSLCNKSEYMQVFPSWSHGPKVAVIIVNGQRGVREQSDWLTDWLFQLVI